MQQRPLTEVKPVALQFKAAILTRGHRASPGEWLGEKKKLTESFLF